MALKTSSECRKNVKIYVILKDKTELIQFIVEA
jgi:hypothetical protein